MYAAAPVLAPPPSVFAPEAAFHVEKHKKEAKRQLQICLALLYSSVLLSSLALSAGSKQVPVSWLAGLALFALLAYLTRGRFDPWRLIAFGVTLAVIVLETALVHKSFSSTSILYMAGIYAPLILTAPLLDEDALRTIWKHVSLLALVITWCGLVQVAGQFVLKGVFIDPLHQLPPSLLLQGYNTTYAVSYGEWLLKPNGMFLLEPSFFSQLIALGLLGEMVYFQRKARMVLFVIGLALSFSGTGLIMLLPAVLFMGSFRALMGFAMLGVILLGIVIAMGYGDMFLARATETGDSSSSGHERFIAPYQEMIDRWEEKTSFFLFGKGAGASDRMSTAEYANFSAIPKVGVEFGLFGLMAFSAMWLGFFYGLALPRALTVGLLVFYFVASGSLLQPFTVFMTWALTAGYRRRNREGR